MEQIRIAIYGMSQVTAIVYGVLAAGAAVKFNSSWLDQGYTLPPIYHRAMFYRDHGYYLLFFVLVWAAGASYLSSQWARHRIEEDTISATGIVLTILFAAIGTVLAFVAAAPPTHLF